MGRFDCSCLKCHLARLLPPELHVNNLIQSHRQNIFVTKVTNIKTVIREVKRSPHIYITYKPQETQAASRRQPRLLTTILKDINRKIKEKKTTQHLTNTYLNLSCSPLWNSWTYRLHASSQ